MQKAPQKYPRAQLVILQQQLLTILCGLLLLVSVSGQPYVSSYILPSKNNTIKIGLIGPFNIPNMVNSKQSEISFFSMSISQFVKSYSLVSTKSVVWNFIAVCCDGTDHPNAGSMWTFSRLGQL
jgi:hypothetical protein